ncbi:hypothetical protein NBRC116590_19380 [Pelagimonas sp. KU-00592-HH]|jgi:hypothetical protein|uniref:hypothetical protein n=1 Tax=Roseobacteraceae TaxID=2854170 RepID=UPI0020CE48D1|nr:hypothetical protein [Shimia sp. CNT1-13L.2]MCP9480579.1 hypothetical protein [Shimia sp. CNT1-13L.2]
MKSLVLVLSVLVFGAFVTPAAADKGGTPNENASDNARGSENAHGNNPNKGPGNNSGKGGGG